MSLFRFVYIINQGQHTWSGERLTIFPIDLKILGDLSHLAKANGQERLNTSINQCTTQHIRMA